MGEIRCLQGWEGWRIYIVDRYNGEGRDRGKDVHPVDRLANNLHQT